ncbi:MAG: tRNA (adenosine(37)-N6)-threonylcarbamoyltransferase complex ATPase subunit type 1 TsaE [Clostridia bacterium]
MKTTYISHSVDETEKLAASLATELKSRRFLCFYGGLGAGKTTFTRGLVKSIIPECLPLVHSPTFAIVNEYLGKTESIFHFDLYRIKNEDDLYSTGFFDYGERNGIILTEWSEDFTAVLPKNAIIVQIEVLSENERKFTITL